MSKYDRLTSHLLNCDTDTVVMSIAQLEEVLGFSLPPYSATAEFWTNHTDFEDNGHPQDRAWQRAGFKVQHQLGSDTVTFFKSA